MLIVVLLGLVGALAAAGLWLREVWASVPRGNADFQWLEG
jgi:hypothetical protein